MKSKGVRQYVILLIVGIVFFMVGGFVLKTEGMKALSGICIGVGAGLFGMSTAQIICYKIIQTHPEYKRQVDIEAKDERNIYISSRAKAKAFDWMGTVFGTLILGFALMNKELVIILLLTAAYLLVHGVYITYLNKYTKEM